MNRRPSQLGGLAAVLVGFLLVGVEVSPLAVLSEYSYVLVLAIGIVMLVVGWSALAGRRLATGEWWNPTSTESGYRVSVPGDELADLSVTERTDRLRRRVVVSLRRTRDCSREEALAHVEDGTWTDDRLAAAYLGADRVQLPLRTRILDTIRRRSTRERALRHTVNALENLRTEEDR